MQRRGALPSGSGGRHGSRGQGRLARTQGWRGSSGGDDPIGESWPGRVTACSRQVALLRTRGSVSVAGVWSSEKWPGVELGHRKTPFRLYLKAGVPLKHLSGRRSDLVCVWRELHSTWELGMLPSGAGHLILGTCDHGGRLLPRCRVLRWAL